MQIHQDPELSLEQVVQILDDGKGENISTLNVTKLSSMLDHMVVVTATSTPHINALCNRVVEHAKPIHKAKPSLEGQPESGWVLIDLGSTIVHVMLQENRDFYQIEELWRATPNTHLKD